VKRSTHNQDEREGTLTFYTIYANIKSTYTLNTKKSKKPSTMKELGPTTSKPEAVGQEAGAEAQQEQENEHDAVVAGLEQRAQELGLSPADTEAAVQAYEDSLVDDPQVAEAIQDKVEDEVSDQLSVDDLLADPSGFMNRLGERESLEEADLFGGLETSLNKLIEDVEGAEGLVDAVEGLGEALKRFMELLVDALKLIQEIITMREELEKLETQEEKDELTRQLQEKIDEFGAKYGER